MLAHSQIEIDVDVKIKSIPPFAITNLSQRNLKPVALDAAKIRSPQVLVIDFTRLKGEATYWGRLETIDPRAKAWASIWLPGYSTDGKTAIVRFSFGPNMHGATATYLLSRQQQWVIKWYDLAYYV